jgi:hypothetical protein
MFGHGLVLIEKPNFQGNLEFKDPASYRIPVQGHLDDSWFDRLDGMALTHFLQSINPGLPSVSTERLSIVNSA